MNRLFSVLVRVLAALAVMALAFVIVFIVKEALPAFAHVAVPDFLWGQRWMPIAYTGEVSFGIFNFLAATLYVSLLGMAIATVLGLGTALILGCVVSDRTRAYLYPFVDLLAGIPSVIYGFVGLVVLVRLLMRAGVSGGSCVLAAGIVLSVMLLPYLVSACAESMRAVMECHWKAAQALGISRWHVMATVVLPGAWKNILLAMMLAVGRAVGETMAVMMVIGNANLFPHLLGKSESIAALIALEMGTAEVGSLHYHALFAAGLALMVLLVLIHTAIGLLRRKLLRKEAL